MSKVYDFLKEHKMLSDSFSDDEIKEAFLKDMEEHKSLAMIKTYQTVNKNAKFTEDVFVIDMGGTNLRFAECKNGEIQNIRKTRMYGLDEEMSIDTFFDLLAEEIEKNSIEKIGFCFSYPCKCLPNKDGEILKFVKEVKIHDEQGRIIGEELNKRLSQKREFSILNDTVAAQLGTQSDIGLILGTGFNICYTDRKTNMIIDSECGQYTFLPRGDFDIAMDKELELFNPCSEKGISGAYLARLMRITAEGYFNRKMDDFELQDLPELVQADSEFKEISEAILLRGAKRVAVMLSCLLHDYGENDGPLRLALEGTTVYKTAGYLDKLKDMISKYVKVPIEYVDARDTILIGAARSTLQ